MEIGPILRAMRWNKLRFGLIAVQIAATLAIVANCVTLILAARDKMSRPPVFDDDNLILVWMPVLDPALDEARRREDWNREIMTRLRGIPGVRSVSSTSFNPWVINLMSGGKPVGSDSEVVSFTIIRTDENFPDALGAEVDEGRWFTRDDVEHAIELRLAVNAMKRERSSDGSFRDPYIYDVVVSRAYGQRVFGEGPLLGKMLDDAAGERIRIIGVLHRYYSPAEGYTDDEYAVFFAGTTHFLRGAPFIVRAEPGRAAPVARNIEKRLSETYDFAQGKVRLVSELRDVHYGPQRMMVALMGLLVFLLLLVASLGIAGLTSFSVAERTRQIGTRRALGATTADILHYFLTEAGLLTTMGLVLGVGLAVLLNMAILTVYADAKLGAGVVGASALLLWIVGLGAALPPALRGARTSPAIATRNV
jgi:putative ABC transport system permease protein